MFILAVFVGIEVIGKVPATSYTVADVRDECVIHGIVLVGAILVAGTTAPHLGPVVSVIVVVLAAINVVGGFVVTERMLQMFKPRANRPEVKR